MPARLGCLEGEELWFRGSGMSSHELLPRLFWKGQHLDDERLDELEQNLFFTFQARARELHERNLSDWDFLFFMRHHHVPTRLLDWTDSFGVAAYFAMEFAARKGSTPCVWVLNPYALNEETWDVRDLVQPKYLGYYENETDEEGGTDETDEEGEEGDDFWDYGELLITPGPWRNNGPVAIYPQQVSERMRMQRGWFTWFGNDRKSLESQYGKFVGRIEFSGKAVAEARQFLLMAGLKPYGIYPDLDHLCDELLQDNAYLLSPPPRRVTKKR